MNTFQKFLDDWRNHNESVLEAATQANSPQDHGQILEVNRLMTYSCTYDPGDDKLRLTASARLDADLYRRVKKIGFRWAPKQELFFCVWSPAAEDICIELAGEIEDEDSTLIERAEVRADRFEGYKEKRTAEAESAHAAVDQISQRFEGGQPILVGHHSEKRARKDAERIQNGMRKALKLWDTANYWTDRAAAALAHAKYLDKPTVRARRIKGLEADVRRYRSQFTPSPADQAPIMQQKWNESGDAPKVPHVFCAPRGGKGGHYVAVESLPAIERHYSRWIAHTENRIAYERAMLNDQGATALLDRKPKSAKAQLPLCNYRQPEGFDIPNEWRRGEMLHYAQVEMTAAEYAKIYSEYKGTRAVNNSHRVRTAVLSLGHRVTVFITDSKVHTPPEAVAPVPVSAPAERVYTPVPETEAEINARNLRDALKQGVKVVSAPQLFPTPPALAARMVELAGIQEGDTVLEPSAGTGAICGALSKAASHSLTCVEVSNSLASALAGLLPDATVINDDFLTCDLPKFDRIIMNPPFTRGQDIAHIVHALKLLKPGGRLVAICAHGPNQIKALQKLAEERGEWEPLPAGTFEESGTGVNTVLLSIDQEPEIEIGAFTAVPMSLFPMEG